MNGRLGIWKRLGLLVGVIAISSFGLASAQGQGGGNKPPNAGGGKPGDKGKPSDNRGSLFADLVRLLRDESGLPIMTQHVLGDGTGVTYCLQPVSVAPIPGQPVVTNPVDGLATSLIPLGTGVEGEECDVQPEFQAFVSETLFGRLNLGRSPTKVLDQQLREVLDILGSSVDPIALDEAGRFVVYLDDDNDGATPPVPAEIDSPGNNLAIYRELKTQGTLNVLLPSVANPGDTSGFLDHTAAALGGAAGKGDVLDVDLVVYNNRILGIPDAAASSGTLPVVAGGAVTDRAPFGTVQIGETGERYIDYEAAATNPGYGYVRSSTFPGCVRGYLANFPVLGTFTPFQGQLLDCVFGTIDYDATDDVGVCSFGAEFVGATAAHGYAQRADDARAVIAFVHSNAVADSTAILPPSIAGVDVAGDDAVCGTLP